MATQKNTPEDRTPFGLLREAGIHHVVGYQVAQASIATMRIFERRVGSGFKLRPVEFTILALVDENPGLSAKQLSEALAIAPPNMAVWIEKLERRGLIERERSTMDRRAQHIRATAAGEQLSRESVRTVLSEERKALATLSPAEWAMLVELLHKVALCREGAAPVS